MTPDELHLDYHKLLHRFLRLEERVAQLEKQKNVTIAEIVNNRWTYPNRYTVVTDDEPDPMERITSDAE